MAARPTSTPRQLLDELTSVLVDVDPGGPSAVGVTLPDAGSVELAVRALPTDDVVTALAGFVAPSQWHAFGVVAPGHGVNLDDGARVDDLVVAVLVTRDGSVCSALRMPDAEGRSVVSAPYGAGDGRVVDACRRVLGVPTAAPDQPVAVWLAYDWVDRVLAAVLSADLGSCPGAGHLLGLEPALAGAGAWSDLRLACAAGAVAIPGVAAPAAAWMDDGFFSREAVAAYPRLLDSLDDLSQLLPQHTFDAVIDHLVELLRVR